MLIARNDGDFGNADWLQEHLARFPLPAATDEMRERAKRHGVAGNMCGRWTVRGVESNQRTHLFRVNCKCWGCKRCGPKKAARYKHLIRENAEMFKLQRFLTLTLDPKTITGDPVPYLRDCWAKFRIYLKRKYGDAPNYICVLEFQKNGTPHLHVLVDRFISQAWIKNVWESIGGGQHVDIRYVDLHRVSRYLSKYLTKELLMSAPKRSRRVTTSRTISLQGKRDKAEKFSLLKIGIDHLAKRFAELMRDVMYEGEGVGKVLQKFSLDFVMT